MKKLLLLFILSLVFVGCARVMDTLPNEAEPPVSDRVIIPDEGVMPSTIPNAETPAVTEPTVTLEEAKKIAFQDAGVTEDKVYGLETDIDLDGNRRYYEIDFKSGGFEYEYDIDAESGKILKKDKERD